jgi:hypothetical protein
MELSEHVTKWVAILLLVIIGIVLFIYLLDQITGGSLVRGLVSTMLFWIPFGSLYTILTQLGTVIPA